MSEGINQVSLDGVLAVDPKWRHTPSGRAVATLTVEHHATEKIPEPLERLDLLLTVVVIAPLSEQCKGWLAGDHVKVEGVLNQKRWLRGGNTRWGKMELVATQIEKIASPQGGTAQESSDETPSSTEKPK